MAADWLARHKVRGRALCIEGTAGVLPLPEATNTTDEKVRREWEVAGRGGKRWERWGEVGRGGESEVGMQHI
jgi:hypothetical protein